MLSPITDPKKLEELEGCLNQIKALGEMIIVVSAWSDKKYSDTWKTIGEHLKAPACEALLIMGVGEPANLKIVKMDERRGKKKA
jgi:hypothetical protein